MNTSIPIQFPSNASVEKHLASGEPWVVVFLDDWCPSCQEFKPIVEFFAEKFEHKVAVHVIRPQDATPKGMYRPQYRVIPYTVFFLGSTVLAEVPGEMRFSDFESALITLYRSFREQQPHCNGIGS